MKTSMSIRIMLISCGLSVAGPTAASAQGAPPADVVKLKNGGMVRGAIIEMVPGQFVEISLANGKTRRYEMSEVEYAGPAGGVPADPAVNDPAVATRAPVAPEVIGGAKVVGRQLRLRLTANFPGVGYHQRTGSSFAIASGPYGAATVHGASYDDLCSTPCEVVLPAGTHRLALSMGGGVPIEAEAVSVDRDAILEGEYISRSGTRTTGWLIFAGTTIGGLALMFTSLPDASEQDPSISTGFWVGTAVATLGPIISLVWILTPDEASISVQ